MFIENSLVVKGLIECKEIICQAVFVLVHPTDYPRFGFVRSSKYDIRCEYDVPDDVFMTI